MDLLEKILSTGLEEMNLPATDHQRRQLVEFLHLLRKWNRVYNLTSIDNTSDMVGLHLLDSLAILPHLKGKAILDVGTGAGLPGLPLAILSPDKEFTLLDSNAKKIRFVRQASIELGLANVNVAHVRIEQFQSATGFDSILARAFAGLVEILGQTLRLLNPGGVILAQKGKLPQAEINDLAQVDVNIIPLHVPRIRAERHLIELKVRS